MRSHTIPVIKDLVLIGGGHSHVIVLRRFGMQAMPGVRITLIGKDVDTPYSGMLPGYIAGHYSHDQIHIDLRPLARFCGARFYHDEVVGLDLNSKHVLCKNRPPVPYDVLSIDIGSTPNMNDIPGAAGAVVPVKPISGFVERFHALLKRVQESNHPIRIGVVGAGAGGTEIALALQHRLQNELRKLGRDPKALSVDLYYGSNEPLASHRASVRAAFIDVLDARGIVRHSGTRIIGVKNRCLVSSDEHSEPLDEILWVTQAGTQSWLKDSGLDVDPTGFAAVQPTLESVSHRGVFAAGDCAAVLAHPREKAGVFAVRQGPPLSDNLRRALRGQRLKLFKPQRQFLSLISTGDQCAVSSHPSLPMFKGKWVWSIKDWIDRRFMRRFNELPQMQPDRLPEPPTGLADTEALQALSAVAMRCGGCGAKVGANVLSRVMARLPVRQRDDVLIGLHSPDDAAIVRVPSGKLLVHTVDAFRAIVDDPYVFGRIAANHALGDIFAMNAQPQTALAIATLPFGLETKIEDLLLQMMTGAVEVLDESDTALVGGHTSEGAELSLGFAINGLVDEQYILRKSGMRAGDRLILTKPIGIGALFAAEMRSKSRGIDISAALQNMQQSNRAAAACIHEHGATACTDVTGFGLLGHLVEMTKASGVDAEIDLRAIPLLAGAEAAVKQGITSSLQPQNFRLRRAIKTLEQVARAPRFPLLFDPQTAGGLLAALPRAQAEACLKALRAKGYGHACVIGQVMPQSDALEPIKVLI